MQPDPPPQRRNDDLPGGKRSDDITLNLPWGIHYKGSGRFLLTLLAVIGVCVVSLGGLAFNVWHDRKMSTQHDQIVRAINLNTYVNSLSEERKLQLDLQEPDEIKQWRRYRDERGGKAP